MATRIQLRRGTAAQWAAADPVLAAGEPGVETDTGIVKVGDGASPWTDLSPLGGGAPLSHSHGLTDLAALIGITIVETSTGVWSNTLPARTVGQYPATFVSTTDPAHATSGVPGKENLNPGDRWVPKA